MRERQTEIVYVRVCVRVYVCVRERLLSGIIDKKATTSAGQLLSTHHLDGKCNQSGQGKTSINILKFIQIFNEKFSIFRELFRLNQI